MDDGVVIVAGFAIATALWVMVAMNVYYLREPKPEATDTKTAYDLYENAYDFAKEGRWGEAQEVIERARDVAVRQ
jgi:hypothetical protein